MSAAGVDHLTGATVADAPPPCRECMWWQTRPGRDPAERRRWIESAEAEFGPWGKVYRDGGRVIGLVQYGPADAFPRAQAMPAGPPSRDAAIITCAYLIEAGSPWALQSLILAAIGECRDRGLVLHHLGHDRFLGAIEDAAVGGDEVLRLAQAGDITVDFRDHVARHHVPAAHRVLRVGPVVDKTDEGAEAAAEEEQGRRPSRGVDGVEPSVCGRNHELS